MTNHRMDFYDGYLNKLPTDVKMGRNEVKNGKMRNRKKVRLTDRLACLSTQQDFVSGQTCNDYSQQPKYLPLSYWSQTLSQTQSCWAKQSQAVAEALQQQVAVSTEAKGGLGPTSRAQELSGFFLASDSVAQCHVSESWCYRCQLLLQPTTESTQMENAMQMSS